MNMGEVSFGGIKKKVCLAYAPEAEVGDYVVVHVGFAISRIDEEEARQVFQFLAGDGRAGRARDPAARRRAPRPATSPATAARTAGP